MNFILGSLRFAVRCALIFSSLVSTTVFAQSAVNGVVVDQADGLPVPGVVVRIPGSFSATVTDGKGVFSFNNSKSNDISLQFSHLSFADTTVAISSTSNSPLRIALQPRTYLSEEVSITATRANDRSAVAYTSIKKEDLEKLNLGQDLPVLLQLQPSVTTTSDAGNGVGYTGIRIRGSDATRVNVTINGIPVNDAESHQVYWVDLPDIAASADNIQLQRGVGTSTNGPGAFGCSLNMQTSTLQSQPFAEINSSYGSFNTQRNAVKFGTGLLHQRFAMDGRVSLINSDGYMDRASSNLQSIYLSGGYYGKKQSLRAVIMSGKEKTYQSWYGVPEDSLATNRTFNMAGLYYDRNGQPQYYNNQTDNYRQNYFQLLYSAELGNDWLLNTALFYTKGKGYYEEYIQETIIDGGGLDPDSITDSIYIQPSYIRQRWLDNDFRGITWSIARQFEKVDFTAGGTASTYDGKHYGEVIWQNYNITPYEPYRYYNDVAEKNDYNLYTKATWNVNTQWFLTGDLQLRHVDYSFTGKDADGNPLPAVVPLTFFNPKAGITYLPSTWHRFYLSASVGQKEPVRDDYRASTANSRPLPEKLIDYEAGYRYNGHKITGGINLYFMDYARQLVLNGSINDVGEYVRESINDSYRAGAEADITWAPSSKWQLQGNLTLSRNRIKNYTDYVYDYESGNTIMVTYDNTAIAFSPAIISAAVITWQPISSLSFSLSNKYVSEQYLDNTQNADRKIDAYFFHDLRAEWSPKINVLKALTFRGAIYNLTNRLYSTNGYTYGTNYFYPQAGINFMGGVTVKF